MEELLFSVLLTIIAILIAALYFFIKHVVTMYRQGKELPKKQKEIDELKKEFSNLEKEISKYKQFYDEVVTGRDVSLPFIAQIIGEHERELGNFFLSDVEYKHARSTIRSWYSLNQRNAILKTETAKYKNIIAYLLYKHPELTEECEGCTGGIIEQISEDIKEKQSLIAEQNYQRLERLQQLQLEPLKKEEESLKQRINILKKEEKKLLSDFNEKQSFLQNFKNQLSDIKRQTNFEFQELTENTKRQRLDYPGLVDLICRLQQYRYDHLESALSSSAYKAAEIVKQFKRENKELLKEKLLYENLLKSYEALFPWLEDFKEVSIDDALKYVNKTNDDEDYETNIKKWLSPEEYSALSAAQKNQLALDRYQKRHKTDWEIGIEYERYIGYIYETQGYTVKYTGALDGIYDMGRDLIAKKDKEILIIQCKRWSAQKNIHEKHIFQLFGTCFVLKEKNPEFTYVPVFYTTTSLSDIAIKCASDLNIKVFQHYDFNDYPLIKCNVGHNEYGNIEKIYHLPFDEQYDKIIIDSQKGEKYAFTVDEAERDGFRKAKRHIKSK